MIGAASFTFSASLAGLLWDAIFEAEGGRYDFPTEVCILEFTPAALDDTGWVGGRDWRDVSLV
jgi:hypothetical protein